MDYRARISTGLLAIGLLLGACNGSRPSASGNDGATDVPVGGSDGGADRADMGSDRADTGGGDAPIETQPDLGGTMDAPIETQPDLPVTMDSGPEIPAECGTIAMNATLTSHLKITADNECDVYVNGTKVGTTTNWGAAVTIDVSLFIHPGRKNVIAVLARNTSSQAGNDRAIIGELTVDADGGVAPLVQTNKDWRTAKSVPDVDAGGADWTTLDYDDSAWSAATEIATNGDPPWGAILGASTAKWIWSAPIPADTANKPDFEVAYARRTFYFSLDGTTIASAPACPAP
jgi:hypothetical protein